MPDASNLKVASDSEFLPETLWQEKAFDGAWRSLASTADVVEPATGKTPGRIAMASAEDITASCASARAAQRAWSDMRYEKRGEILRRAASVVETHSSEIVEWLVRESGSAAPKAHFEVAITVKALYEAAAMPSQAHGQVLPSAPGKISIARRRPIGVVGVIAPFNFPLYLAMRAVAPALAVGNSVVLKPDPRTAVCGGLVIARIFELAGLPAGTLHVLPGDGAAGAALCSDKNVSMIQFTGSTAAGRKVGEAAARHLKKVSLELGGKNSLIILDDADLDIAISNASWGAYLHQGQICMATGRVLVQSGVVEAFSARIAEKAKSLTAGPLINQSQSDHALDIVNASVAGGARLLAGGTAEGAFFQPTVLTDVASGMRAYDEEIFAPVLAITPFETDEDAIRLANDTEYGLSAAIITNSINRALAIGERLNVGLLHINDQTVNDEVVNPFGGVGASGNGSSIGGPANWEEFTQWQWMTIQGAAPAYPL